MSAEYLKNYAVRNSWCDPARDMQYHILGKRITRPDGALGLPGAVNYGSIGGRRYQLPELGKRYHIFFIGQIPPQAMNLLYGRIDANGNSTPLPGWIRGVWMNFGANMASQRLMVDIYSANGEHVPAFNSWYMFTEHSALVFCVEEDSKLAMNYGIDELCLRVYSNRYYRRGVTGPDDFIMTKGYKNITNNQILELQTLYHSHNTGNRVGKTQAWVNGYKVPTFVVGSAKVGDTVEIVYDGSIRTTRSFTIKDLKGFTSIRDSGEGKLLLHNPSRDINGNYISEIEFIDDVDIYVSANVKVTSAGVQTTKMYGYMLGGHYPKNKRQVTHRDYSVSYDGIYAVANNLKEDLLEDNPTITNVVGGVTYVTPQTLNVENFIIQAVVRNDGINQPLVGNASRIQELYSLDDEDILIAMTGVTASVPEWRAENLENSAFIRHLDAYYSELTAPLLRDAFGYNAISKIVGDTPQQLINTTGSYLVELPPQLRIGSTVYEYDANGFFIGPNPHIHVADINYIAHSPNARTIEAISGIGTDTPDIKFGTNNIAITEGHNFKVYKCNKVNGVPNDEWEDITNSNLYNVVNGAVMWAGGVSNHLLAVKSDSKFLAITTTMQDIQGVMEFTLAQIEDRGNGPETTVLTIPYAQMDVILNNKSLIRNIDYVLDFPKVIIYNKAYLNMPATSSTQELVIRCYGFCNSDMSVDPVDDYGFIEHGLLSNNHQFNLVNNKVLRITLDGALKRKDQVSFSEYTQGSDNVNPLNGKPYQVKDIIVPMRGYTDIDTYGLREIALATDYRVSSFLTAYVDQPPRQDVSAIVNKHILYSPFFSRIINLMLFGTLTESLCATAVRDIEILELVQDHDYLFATDPLNPALNSNFNYVQVQPYVNSGIVTLGVEQYRVLFALAGLYARNNLILSDVITLT